MIINFDYSKYQTFDDVIDINKNIKFECVEYIGNKCFRGRDLTTFAMAEWFSIADYIIERFKIKNKKIISEIEDITSQYGKFYFTVIYNILEKTNTDLFKLCYNLVKHYINISEDINYFNNSFEEIEKYIYNKYSGKDLLRIINLFKIRKNAIDEDRGEAKLLGYDEEEAAEMLEQARGRG